MKKLLIILALVINAFALSPFSLEGFKEANVKVLGKNKNIPKELKKKIKNEIIKQLEIAGIKTSSEEYSNFAVKIELVKLKDIFVVNVSMFIVEDVIPTRDKELENMGITYKKNDMFDTTAKDLEKDIYESAIEYLLFDFLEQYKDENS